MRKIKRIILPIICILSFGMIINGCAAKKKSKMADEFIDIGITDDVKIVCEGEDADLEPVDCLQMDSIDAQYGTSMVSDEKYIYFAYRKNGDIGGLYRADKELKGAEMIDRGKFCDMCLSDGKLYYFDENDGSYTCLMTTDLSAYSVSSDEYENVLNAVNTGTYFGELLSEDFKDPDNPDLSSVKHFSLSYTDENGTTKQTGVLWDSPSTSPIGFYIYGDSVFYSRPCKFITEDDENYSIDMPCCYNTKTGTESVILRNRHPNWFSYLSGATAGYLMITDKYLEKPEGEGTTLESIADPTVSVKLSDLIDGAPVAAAFTERDEKEKQDQIEANKNEKYGPGESELSLEAPSDKSAAFRLVRMDGSTEFLKVLEPGESVAVTFPSGRYTLKTAEGDKWISDSEAFGEDGTYASTDVYTFEPGKSYEIGTGIAGSFHSDSSGGFTN